MAIHSLWEHLDAEPSTAVERVPFARLQTVQRGASTRHRSSPILAVDVSLWMFHAMEASSSSSFGGGGLSPALRTIFYRLCRLLQLGIQHAVFVFDGSQRPEIKQSFSQNHVGGPRGGGAWCSSEDSPFARLERQVQRLVPLFGYQVVVAVGEAEAECARLQQIGSVDAVLSDDNDCFVFGATTVVRNWKPQLSKESPSSPSSTQTATPAPRNMQKSLTHPYYQARVYRAETLATTLGLTRERLLLLALLVKSDYGPGVRNMGLVTALELVRCADYAERWFALIQLNRQQFLSSTETTYPALVQHLLLPLIQEINATLCRRGSQHRENKDDEGPRLSRSRPSALLPEDASFPPRELLLAYWFPTVHAEPPVVNVSETVPNLPALRDFTRTYFGWGDTRWESFWNNTLLPALHQQCVVAEVCRRQFRPISGDSDCVLKLVKVRNRFGFEEVLVEWNEDGSGWKRFLRQANQALEGSNAVERKLMELEELEEGEDPFMSTPLDGEESMDLGRTLVANELSSSRHTPPPPPPPSCANTVPWVVPGAPRKHRRARTLPVPKPKPFLDRIYQAYGVQDEELIDVDDGVLDLEDTGAAAEVHDEEAPSNNLKRPATLVWIDSDHLRAVCPNAFAQFQRTLMQQQQTNRGKKRGRATVAKTNQKSDGRSQRTLDMFWSKRARSRRSTSVDSIMSGGGGGHGAPLGLEEEPVSKCSQ